MTTSLRCPDACSNHKHDSIVIQNCQNRPGCLRHKMRQAKAESQTDHPAHYGGDTVYEAIKVIEAWGLGFCLGNTVKYISRAGKKDPAKEIEDLEKALWYLNRHIEKLKTK